MCGTRSTTSFCENSSCFLQFLDRMTPLPLVTYVLHWRILVECCQKWHPYCEDGKLVFLKGIDPSLGLKLLRKAGYLLNRYHLLMYWKTLECAIHSSYILSLNNLYSFIFCTPKTNLVMQQDFILKRNVVDKLMLAYLDVVLRVLFIKLIFPPILFCLFKAKERSKHVS